MAEAVRLPTVVSMLLLTCECSMCTVATLVDRRRTVEGYRLASNGSTEWAWKQRMGAQATEWRASDERIKSSGSERGRRREGTSNVRRRDRKADTSRE